MNGLLELLQRLARFVVSSGRGPKSASASRERTARSQLRTVTGTPEPPEVSAARCPEHGEILETSDLDGVLVCPTCGGCLVVAGLDAQVLDDPAHFAPLELERLDVPFERPRYRKCPVCPNQMVRTNLARVSGVMVDRCPKHGTWFDPGELRAALDFASSGGLERKAAFEDREATWQKEQKKVIDKLNSEGRRGGAGMDTDIDYDFDW